MEVATPPYAAILKSLSNSVAPKIVKACWVDNGGGAIMHVPEHVDVTTAKSQGIFANKSPCHWAVEPGAIIVKVV